MRLDGCCLDLDDSKRGSPSVEDWRCSSIVFTMGGEEESLIKFLLAFAILNDSYMVDCYMKSSSS